MIKKQQYNKKKSDVSNVQLSTAGQPQHCDNACVGNFGMV